MGRPLTFSVGIPAFNQGQFLEETILSLLHQTRPPDEIVVSDHHSTDNTPEVIAKYAGRVRTVKPPPGVNLTGQYNFTLQSQTCDWISLLSSDDIARPNFCETLLRGAASRKDAVLVRSGWESIDATGKVIGQNYLLSVPKVEASPANLISQRYAPKVNFAAFAIQRDAYLRSGPILESLESLADWALFLQLSPFGTYVYEHALISGYRVGHDGNKFKDRLAAWCHDQRLVFQKVMPLAAERSGIGDTSFIHEANRYNFMRYLANASNEFTPAERPAILQHFHDWAREVDCVKAFEDFAAGKQITTPLSLFRRMRRSLHPFVHRVYSIIRR